MLPEAVVFDSSAILAVLNREPGSAAILPLLAGGLASAVNVSEVHARLMGLGIEPGPSWHRAQALGCVVVPFGEEQARRAAELIPVTRPYGLSLGDRACLALAMERGAKVYTADRIWDKVPVNLEIRVIR